MKLELPLTVALRVRPMNRAEHRSGAKTIAHTLDNQFVVLLDPTTDPDDILRANRSKERRYVFDHTFDQMATQQDIYEGTTKNLIQDVIQGYNVTVFAYGATGAGKTYTMLGTSSNPGIMVLTLNDLFEQMKANEEEVIYDASMCYMEVYNEVIKDLLVDNTQELELREDSNGDIKVNGLSSIKATSTAQVMGLLSQGNRRRSNEPTEANEHSSRSHGLLKVTVRSRSRVVGVNQEVHTGCLFMVDLAGSERAAGTKNYGMRMLEGAHINRSLLALANCINALVLSQPFVNFRDSKLTRLLKESLSGNSKTVMIAHVSPASNCFEESRNTLLYAERTKQIKTKVLKNTQEIEHHVLQYRDMIDSLRHQIALQEEKLANCQCMCKRQDLISADELCHKLADLFAEQNEIREAICGVRYHLVTSAIDTQRQVAIISQYRLETTPTKLCGTPPPISVPNIELQLEGDPPVARDDGAMVKEEQQHQKDIFDTLHKESVDIGGMLHSDASPSRGSGNIDASTGGERDKVLEPASVSQARAELATLVSDRQRMEAQHKRLQRRLSELDEQMKEVHDDLGKMLKLPTQHQQYIQYLENQQESQTKALNFGIASATGALKMCQQDHTTADLLKQCSETLELVVKQLSLMEEKGIVPPEAMKEELKRLKIKQSMLVAQVAADSKLLSTDASDLPPASSFSAKIGLGLIQGSKSNLLEEDEQKQQQHQQQQHSNIHLPKLAAPRSTVATGWGSNVSTTNTDIMSLTTTVSPIDKDGIADTNTKSLPRSSTSLPTVNQATNGGHGIEEKFTKLTIPHLPLLTKVINPPNISISRCSSRVKRKYMVRSPPAKPSPHTRPTDKNDINTTSMTSLGTTKSNPIGRKYVKKPTKNRSSLSDIYMKPQKKILSQVTQNRLKETRTLVTVSQLEQQGTRRTSVHHPVLRNNNNNNQATPSRNPPKPKPHPPKRVLVPHKVEGPKFTSPYLSSPARAKNMKSNHNSKPGQPKIRV